MNWKQKAESDQGVAVGLGSFVRTAAPKAGGEGEATITAPGDDVRGVHREWQNHSRGPQFVARWQGNLPYRGDISRILKEKQPGRGWRIREAPGQKHRAVSTVPISMGLARKCILETPAGEGGRQSQCQ